MHIRRQPAPWKKPISRRRNSKAIDQTKDATSESLRALVQLHGFDEGLPCHRLYQLWPKRKRASYHLGRESYGTELNPAPEWGWMRDYLSADERDQLNESALRVFRAHITNSRNSELQG
ncbi:hypothetical protein BDW71DRAFT_105068 [Aspergillus fruticulosus]